MKKKSSEFTRILNINDFDELKEYIINDINKELKKTKITAINRRKAYTNSNFQSILPKNNSINKNSKYKILLNNTCDIRSNKYPLDDYIYSDASPKLLLNQCVNFCGIGF